MEMIIIKQDSNEWNLLWEWLGNHPLNENLPEPSIALNNGEVWQYMGSWRNKDGHIIHSLRHRSHPIDGEVKNLSVNAIGIVTDDDIEIRTNVK